MARYKIRPDGSKLWTLESDSTAPLSEQMDELAHIFNHESRRSAGNKFLFQLLDFKATWLAEAARRQEKEMKTLKDDVAALKEALAEVKKELAEMKEPSAGSLDKPKPEGGIKL